MAQCWERRGCDEEMMSRCPHNIPGEPCPADCRFALAWPSALAKSRGRAIRTGFCSSRANRFETRASARSARQSQRATAAVQDICAAARYPHTSKEPTKGRRWQSRLTAR